MYEIYTIKDLDTWDSVAEKYETTAGVLKQINGIMDDDGIGLGMQIVVPTLKRQPYKYYTVKKGDTMEMIANENDIDYFLLLQLNGLDEGDYVYPNQTIILPKDDIDIYMTKNDDTLDYVLKKMGVTIDELIKENENVYLLPEQILVFRKK